jgi:hypothetical protein
MEEHRFRVFDNRVLRIICGRKQEEAIKTVEIINEELDSSGTGKDQWRVLVYTLVNHWDSSKGGKFLDSLSNC